ncbi:MAG: oxygen-independent coproporphyrinogen III oxidase [Sandaracinaceae bacterium]
MPYDAIDGSRPAANGNGHAVSTTGFDRDGLFALLTEHARPLPRYTSYPSVPHWDRAVGEGDYLEALDDVAARPQGACSVYVHLPFCAKRCFYCGCNARTARNGEMIDRYLDHVEREVTRVVERIGRGRPVTQLHWGGGTPNFLSDAQIVRLFEVLTAAFRLDDDAEVSLEMDPRVATPHQPRLLRDLGFNRLSMGVQDFDPRVQAAIGRIQPESDTVSLLGWARDAGFDAVNFDLVYGLPYQTPESFGRTLRRVTELRPDRVATFSYAHLPDVRKIQRGVDATGLPDARTKLTLLLDAVDVLGDAGYAWIGFDHFAAVDDELAAAARERRLLRNFMGYTTRAAPDLLAFGLSAIGHLGGRFAQNDSTLAGYQGGLDSDRFPVVRGHRLSADDTMRASVIQHLMCNLELREDLTTPTFGAPLSTLIPDAEDRLGPCVDAGFLDRSAAGWDLTTTGRFFLRNVAAALDPHLTTAGPRRATFSNSV